MGRKKYPHRKRRIYIYIFTILIFTVSIWILFETRIRPVLRQVASAKAKSVAVSIISDEINRIIIEENIGYSDLANLQMDNDGQVCAVTTNIVEINRLKAIFANHIQAEMDKIDKMSIKIPAGTLVTSGIFSGYGPKIPLRLTTIGRAEVDIKDSFLEAGINQTRHEIYLFVRAKMSVILPGGNIGDEVDTKILIAQSVIVGDVPESVTNVSGLTDDQNDTVLNFID